MAKFCLQFILIFNNKYSIMKLLVVLFLYKLYAHINIFKHIKEREAWVIRNQAYKDYSKTTSQYNKDKV